MELVKKIDIHVHIISSPGILRPRTGVTFCLPEELFPIYDAIGVEKGVISPLFKTEQSLEVNSNREIRDLVKQYPQRLAWFCGVDPRQGDNRPTTDFSYILNYYKAAMELRNRFPSIARGTVTYYPEGQNGYICVITKEYQDEKITIVFNMDAFEQTVTLNQDMLGYTELVGELYAAGGEFSFDESGALVMPPQSIAIFQ